MTIKIVDKDNGWKALAKKVYGLEHPKIKVGIFEQQGAEQKRVHEGDKPRPVTLIEVAVANEFGLGVPERSFIRAWFDQNEDRARKMLSALLQAVLMGKRTKEQVLELLGQKFVAEIQDRISRGIDPPNAPSTIAHKNRKGQYLVERKKRRAEGLPTPRGGPNSMPLIDTGQLRSSISYRVEP